MAKFLGSLSAKYESNGNPGTISTGQGDSGGKSYGIHQFASNMGVVDKFVDWLISRGDEFSNYGKVLKNAGPVGSGAFDDKWQELANIDPGNFEGLQHEYSSQEYYSESASQLMNRFGFDIENRSFALKEVLFSNSIQHGPYYGAEIFRDAANLAGKSLLIMTDQELIWHIYEVKLTDLSWSSGAPALRPGLFRRWNEEREDALNLLREEENE